jgi:tRNA(Glu) U13 pseudouridine synthase TruD
MALRLRFALPAGSYATVVVAELLGRPESSADAPAATELADEASADGG